MPAFHALFVVFHERDALHQENLNQISSILSNINGFLGVICLVQDQTDSYQLFNQNEKKIDIFEISNIGYFV